MPTKVYHNISTSDGRYRAFKVGEVSAVKQNNTYENLYAVASGKAPNHIGLTAIDPLIMSASVSTSMQNRLYSKLKDTIQNGEQGALATSVAEWESSLGMITRRAHDLRKAWLDFKNLHWSRAWRRLNSSKSSQRRRVHYPDITELWLEYWMGWAPLYGDIWNALDVIQRPPPLNSHFSVTVAGPLQPWLLVSNSPNEFGYNRDECKGTAFLSAYGTMKITNHNLYIANQLGLVNPAVVAWELVPFSFVADWVVNVKQVLESLTTFVGVSLTNTGQSRRADYHSSRVGNRLVYVDGKPTKAYYSYTGRATYKRRSPGALPSPSLHAELPKLPLTRAATAISLLVEVYLKPERAKRR